MAEPIAYTIVARALAEFNVAGPITTVEVPASTTSALIEPAGRSALASFGLVNLAKATLPLARTSTAGAAASCRTTNRALPAPTIETSFA